MRAAAMAASHPACPAPTTTTSNCSVKAGMDTAFLDFIRVRKTSSSFGYSHFPRLQREVGYRNLEILASCQVGFNRQRPHKIEERFGLTNEKSVCRKRS